MPRKVKVEHYINPFSCIEFFLDRHPGTRLRQIRKRLSFSNKTSLLSRSLIVDEDENPILRVIGVGVISFAKLVT